MAILIFVISSQRAFYNSISASQSQDFKRLKSKNIFVTDVILWKFLKKKKKKCRFVREIPVTTWWLSHNSEIHNNLCGTLCAEMTDLIWKESSSLTSESALSMHHIQILKKAM